MEAEKRYRFGCGLAILVIALATFEGLVIGWLYARHIAGLSAEAALMQNPGDSLDGLGFILLAGILLGGFVGFIYGLTVSCATYNELPAEESINNS